MLIENQLFAKKEHILKLFFCGKQISGIQENPFPLLHTTIRHFDHRPFTAHLIPHSTSSFHRQMCAALSWRETYNPLLSTSAILPGETSPPVRFPESIPCRRLGPPSSKPHSQGQPMNPHLHPGRATVGAEIMLLAE